MAKVIVRFCKTNPNLRGLIIDSHNGIEKKKLGKVNFAESSKAGWEPIEQTDNKFLLGAERKLDLKQTNGSRALTK